MSQDRQEVYPAKTYGTFFPELFKNPGKYIIYQPDLRVVLQKLRDQGKVVFLGTNSMFDYMELICSSTLGKDWRSFFDFVFCDCRKPNFFKSEAIMYPQATMYERDPKSSNQHGDKVGSYLDLKQDAENVTYLEGNYSFLDYYLKKKFNKERP